MINLIEKNFNEISIAFFETNFMLFVSMTVCLIFSIPLSILLFSLNKKYFLLSAFEYPAQYVKKYTFFNIYLYTPTYQ